MKDTEFYQLLMHIRPPWTVERVLIDEKEKTVTLSVAHPEGLGWPCPECGKKCPLHDPTPERVWRHLDCVGYKTFILSIREHVAKAKEEMVFDRFHIMKHANEGVDKGRRNENRELWKEGDPALKGSKYLWLHRARTLPEKHRTRFKELQALNLKTGRAYALKEGLAELWDHQSRAWAEKYRGPWHLWATHSRRKPMIEVARMIQEHLNGVMNFFTHRITNTVAERLNSKVATIQKMAYGFRNKEHFKIAVLFWCGGLQLYPGMLAPPG